MPDALTLERPRHGDLVKTQADRDGESVVDPEIVEGLADIEIRFAGRHDTEPRSRTVDEDAVEPVCTGEGESGVKLMLVEPVLLF